MKMRRSIPEMIAMKLFMVNPGHIVFLSIDTNDSFLGSSLVGLSNHALKKFGISPFLPVKAFSSSPFYPSLLFLPVFPALRP